MRVVFENVGRDVYLDEVDSWMVGSCYEGPEGWQGIRLRLFLETESRSCRDINHRYHDNMSRLTAVSTTLDRLLSQPLVVVGFVWL
jgi:hypothetical protein